MILSLKVHSKKVVITGVATRASPLCHEVPHTWQHIW